MPIIESSFQAHPVSFKMRNYFSSHYLWAAKHFSQLAKAIENNHTGRSRFDIEHRAYVTNSIFSTVAFLEAAINEVFQDVNDDESSYIKGITEESLLLMKDHWKLTNGGKSSSTLSNYQIALFTTRSEIFAEGKSPYQDADVVIKLRNWLTHYKPQWISEGDPHSLEKRLENNQIPRNPLMVGSGNPEFPDKYLGSGCADWAIMSIEKFTDEFFSRISIVPNYQRAKFDTQ